jgi:predicted enzyme related to lactoylglutathione lyase
MRERRFVGVDAMDAALAKTRKLGGKVVQEPVSVPGVTFALISDLEGHAVGLAQQG